MEKTVKIRKGRHYACGLPSFLEGMEKALKEKTNSSGSDGKIS